MRFDCSGVSIKSLSVDVCVCERVCVLGGGMSVFLGVGGKMIVLSHLAGVQPSDNFDRLEQAHGWAEAYPMKHMSPALAKAHDSSTLVLVRGRAHCSVGWRKSVLLGLQELVAESSGVTETPSAMGKT